MALETVRVTAVLPASADRVYAAWLDSREHTRMTGSEAAVDPRVGGEHSAWDGYIEGRILELEPGRRIVQAWRTTDFPLGHTDSRLEVHLLDVEGGCEVTLVHAEIPEGQGAQYEQGWRDHYLEPMAKYFAKSGKPKAAGAKKSKAGPKNESVKKAAKKTATAGTARKEKRKPARKARRK